MQDLLFFSWQEACKAALWSVPWQRNCISLSKTLRNDGWKVCRYSCRYHIMNREVLLGCFAKTKSNIYEVHVSTPTSSAASQSLCRERRGCGDSCILEGIAFLRKKTQQTEKPAHSSSFQNYPSDLTKGTHPALLGYGHTWDLSSLSLKGQQPAVSLCFQLSIMGYPEVKMQQAPPAVGFP